MPIEPKAMSAEREAEIRRIAIESERCHPDKRRWPESDEMLYELLAAIDWERRQHKLGQRAAEVVGLKGES